MSTSKNWKDWVVVADKPENQAWTPEQVVTYSQGLTATFNDCLYFQGLREAAQVLKDWAMVAYYDYLLRRYEP